MRLKVNNYVYKNPILDNITILNISDIHSEIKYIDLVLNYLKQNKVDYILVPGDIVDHTDRDNKDFLNKFKELGKYAKTYIALGNHDNLHLKEKKLLKQDELKNEDLYRILSKQDNIVLSIKPFTSIDINKDLAITLVNLPNYYYLSKEKVNNSIEFFKEIEDNQVDSNKFNIMLVHSPNAIINKQELIKNNLIDKMNLIVAGHNHGGITPTTIQDKLNNHIGLLGPYSKFINKNAYGIYSRNNTYLLISNGITKISKSTGLKIFSGLVNNLFIPEIDIITFKKDNEYNLELTNRNIYKG